MHAVSASRVIPAPAAVVWSVITDVGDCPNYLGAVTAVEILAGPNPIELGTKWRETRSMFGRSTTEEMVVTGLIPGEQYTVTSQAHNAVYTSTLTVTPIDAGSCSLALSFASNATGNLARLGAATVGRLFAPATRRALVADLVDIEAAAVARRPRG